ncbi:MAG: transposase [Anaerolineae bacterium]|nr:transposase [Anaerolineae bacterium]
MTGAGFAQALVLGGLAQPEATRKQVHHQAIQAGLRVSVQGLDQRFTERAGVFMRELLEATLKELVQGEGKAVVLPQFNGVYITDCTRLVWGEAGMKLGVRWEIQRGHLHGCLMDIQQNDQKADVVEGEMPRGALHLGDLGFFKLKRFQAWNDEGVFWLTRYKVGTRLYSLDGPLLDLKTLLSGSETVRMPVRVGSGRNAFVAHLLASPLPEAALSKRLARLKEQARLDQRSTSQRQLELAAWTLYLTNIPDLSFDQAHILARTRWQIELLFKLWKSHAQVLRSRSADPLRQRCEGLAKLIGVILAHWTLLVADWQHDRLGALDALRILRTHVPVLQRAFTYASLFADFFQWLRLDLAYAPRRAKRRKTPLAFQFWCVFEDSYA